ncbi:tetratricopeptide repeat protein [Mucilaginibacter sp. AW1-3]
MLKRIIYLALLFALPLLGFGKDNEQALFEQGNTQYAKANYKAAAESYQKILNDGYQSKAVYFNLGNAYYKLGDIPSALLYYEKARKLAPGDDDINFNIQFANLKTTDKIDDAPQLFLVNWWHSIILVASVNTLSTFSILFLLAGFGLLAYYLFARSISRKKASFYSGIVIIIFGLLSIFIASRQSAYFESHHEAIVFSPSVTAKSGPDNNAKNLFVIHDGTKVTIVENNSGWIKIRLLNGSEGWINLSDAKEI